MFLEYYFRIQALIRNVDKKALLEYTTAAGLFALIFNKHFYIVNIHGACSRRN